MGDEWVGEWTAIVEMLVVDYVVMKKSHLSIIFIPFVRRRQIFSVQRTKTIYNIYVTRMYLTIVSDAKEFFIQILELDHEINLRKKKSLSFRDTSFF